MASEDLPLEDPLAALGGDIGAIILSHLPPRQLLKCALVSTAWRDVANRPGLWRTLCTAAWAGKVYNPAASRQDLSWKQRYLMAEAERKRTVLTREEVTSNVWKFRFKRTAGSWWAFIDPYWVHGKDEAKMMRRVFTNAGAMTATCGPHPDPLMAEGEAMRWRFTADGRVQVEDYPALTVKRRADWGFTMENLWVVFIAEVPAEGA